jgi:DNA (cytosine-5)-methyltransferase 1
MLEADHYDRDNMSLILDINDFEIYTCPTKKRAWELTSLKYLDVQGRQLCFDGVLSIGNVKRYVQGASIKSYSVEGYGDEDEPVTVNYIQSQVAFQEKAYDIWYRLKRPSTRYEEYHKLFDWASILGKHTIDFLESRPHGTLAGLYAFREEFVRWLLNRYPNNHVFDKWLNAYGSKDFRKAVHAHIDYLYQEAYNLSNREALLKHPLWAECMRASSIIKNQPMNCAKTITTPHTHICFKNRFFAKQLLRQDLSEEIQYAQERRKKQLGFPPGTPQPRPNLPLRPLNVSHFKIGDVVGILPSEVEQEQWIKGTTANKAKANGATAETITMNDLWYAYVHQVKSTDKGHQKLYIYWLYFKGHTTIDTTDYPVTNELFMSNNSDEITSDDVVARCTVEWFAQDYKSKKDFIVRQKYDVDDNSFVSLKASDLASDYGTVPMDNTNSYEVGETVYMIKNSTVQYLEPVVIDQINQKERKFKVRRLLRLENCAKYAGTGHRPDVEPNELVWTDELFEIKAQNVIRKCHVRYFTEDQIKSRQIPHPYNRGGAGDFWILATGLTRDRQHLKYLRKAPVLLIQGPDLEKEPPFEKLQGLSLFSGLGNLDKGLEEGGAVEFNTSVEYSPASIHTLHANAKDPENSKLWFGSVDDYLQTLISGKKSNLVAKIGEVDVIAAGSPCPGFSKMQQNPDSANSHRNASLITTFCSYLDVYRPKWAFLENVVNMAAFRKGHEEERILCQMIACLVVMGYQVHPFIMSSWNYGSCQCRSRIILSIAAPGLPLIAPPEHTHSHPDGKASKWIGTLSSGEKFGRRAEDPTPFKYVSAKQALDHLPDIGNGQVNGCIEFPDHRLLSTMNARYRKIIEYIPLDPQGKGLQWAIDQGIMPKFLYRDQKTSKTSRKKKDFGHAFVRIERDGLVTTITTHPAIRCTRNGKTVHYRENRSISLEEGRIIQGIPRNEIIIGTTSEQMKQIGNAVDRHIALPLGLKLRYALEKSLLEKPEPLLKNGVSSSKVIVGGYAVPEPRGVEHTVDIDSTDDTEPATRVSIPERPERPKRENRRLPVRFLSRDDSDNTGSDTYDHFSRRLDHVYIPAARHFENDSTDTGSIIDVEYDSPVEQPRFAVSGPKSIFNRFSETLAQGISMLQTSLSAPQPLPGAKRPRAAELEELADPYSTDDLQSNKRPRQETKSKISRQTSMMVNLRDTPEILVDSESSDPIAPTRLIKSDMKRRQASSTPSGFLNGYQEIVEDNTPTHPAPSAHPRKTRHSGLSVEFQPKAWNQRVEREVKEEKRRRRMSRPYA